MNIGSIKNNCFKLLPKQKILLGFFLVIFLVSQLITPSFIYSKSSAVSSPSPIPAPSTNPDLGIYGSLPNIAPKSKEDYLVLPYYKQIQKGQLAPNQVLLLNICLRVPFLSIESKLNLYNKISALHLPLINDPNTSPAWLFAIVSLWPLFILIFLVLSFFFLRFLLGLTRSILPIILKKFGKIEQKIFLELTFPSDTGKSAYATEQLYTLLHSLARRRTFSQHLAGEKIAYSLEIVSSRDEGIRFVLVSPPKDAETIKRSLLSYLPGLKIKEANDYLPEPKIEEEQLEQEQTIKAPKKAKLRPKQDEVTNITPMFIESILELKLSNHFALSLKDQKALSEHDPIAYLTGAMTKLNPGELVSFQVVTTPVLSSVHGYIHHEMSKLQYKIRKGEPISPLLFPGTLEQIKALPFVGILFFLFVLCLKIIGKLLYIGLLLFASIPDLLFSKSAASSAPIFTYTSTPPETKLPVPLDTYEQELHNQIRDKISQHLFETSIRVLVMAENESELEARISHILASFGPFTNSNQSFSSKDKDFPFSLIPSFLVVSKLAAFIHDRKFTQFKNRVVSPASHHHHNPILSAPEITDVYHFPYTDLTKTEGLVKSKSKQLPAPLSMKKSDTKLDVIVGANLFGGELTKVGLSLPQRRQHTYIVGKTGTGKTTIIKGMALQDILAGKGVCVIDPHGDMIKELLKLIPKKRIKDVVYINPADKDYPVGLNILSPGGRFIDEDEQHEWITNSLLSVFMKITPKEHWGQRMEHILRNATLTALQARSPTLSTPYISLYTIQKLLTDTNYRKEVVANIPDPVLKQFWQKEFSMFGNMQQGEAVSPLTNKLGEFITSKLTRYIVLQKDSTINISQIMDEGKILLVNLSKGDLGEERSAFFGTLITSLIQLATYQRAQIPENKRRDFFVYIDEFQNFATHYFTNLFSESRKYHVFFIPSHQNIAQIDDVKVAKIVLSNSGTVIALKNGPDDERVLLPFLEPEVEKGEIINLAPHNFYMKVTNDQSEDAFSGQTILVEDQGSQKIADQIIENSRQNYALPRTQVEKHLNKLFGVETKPKRTTNGESKNGSGKHLKIGLKDIPVLSPRAVTENSEIQS